jgi:hypothetical protein
MVEEIRSGALQLAVPPSAVPFPAASPPAPVPSEESQPARESRTLLLELTNAKSWLSGKHAKLILSVRRQGGDPASRAQLRVQIEGSENGETYQGQTDVQGQAEIEFDMPRIRAAEAALVIHAENHASKGHLRFTLRAKPRVA